MRMKREMVLWFVVAASGLADVAAAAGLLRPAAEDQVPTTLVAPPPAAPATAERSEVAFSWPVDPAAPVESAPSPRVASREYWVTVEAAELRQGFELFTTAPGALVRIQPAGPDTEGRIVDPRDLTIAPPGGAERPVAEAADALASAAELAAADAPFAEGTSAFRLRDELGAGRFLLRAAAAAPGRYLLHVFDRGSALALVVESARADYLGGERLALAARLVDAGVAVAADRMEGFVVSPAGRMLPVALRRAADGSFAATAALPRAVESGAGGLWELVASARGSRDGLVALRTARVAFAVATPTARLDGSAEPVALRRDGTAVRFGVETAVAGRYELRGVLWGTDAQGRAVAAAVGHAAAWLEAGRGALTLRFDPAALRAADLAGPWEVRGLELRDQGRMGLLERRARALVLTP
jgi:hypothetical protein